MAATLASLGLDGSPYLGPTPDPAMEVSGLSVDSRETRPGHLFAALRGVETDGAEFAGFAVRSGARVILTSLDGALRARDALEGRAVPILIADDPRRRLAEIAAAFHGGQPETLTAVTGTNGKTSVAAFTRQIFAACGRTAVNFGTTGVEGAVARPLSHTTPEPITLHALLADLAAEGVTHAAMEASSHGLAQRRLDGARLAAVGLTNISRDHLDYHADYADYAAAKLGLFSRVAPDGAAAVLNADDPVFPVAEQIARQRGLRVIPVGEAAGGDGLRIDALGFTPDGLTLRFSRAGAAQEARLALIGGFQAHNALVAAGLAIGAGEAPEAVFAALNGLKGVRGRMELVARRGNGASVFVDYAHTPDALATALAALRAHTPGRLVVVFGAGGDRDPGKRALMGAAAANGADLAIVTDDNPRSEDPAAIRAAIMKAAPEAEEVGDRTEAILHGVDALGPEDRLLIAGKGHETGQIVDGRVIPFDDSEQARAAAIALDAGGF